MIADNSKRWTVCHRLSDGTVKKLCQYVDRARADSHAASLTHLDAFVQLCDRNPERIVELRGRRRSCVGYRKVGLPQY
jgi:hypothetical protein